MHPMKILWVKAGGLVPPDTGGKIRSYNILRQLAKNHEVTFFSFYAAHENDVHPELGQIFQRVVLIPLDLPKAKGAGELLDYAVHLFSREPYNLTKYCRPIVRNRLRELLQQETYDVILCDFLAAAGAIPWDWPCPKVLFTHNVEAAIWQRHFEVARNPLWKAVSWLEWKRMAAGGTQIFEESRSCSCCFAKRLGNFRQIPGSTEIDGDTDRCGHGLFPAFRASRNTQLAGVYGIDGLASE